MVTNVKLSVDEISTSVTEVDENSFITSSVLGVKASVDEIAVSVTNVSEVKLEVVSNSFSFSIVPTVELSIDKDSS